MKKLMMILIAVFAMALLAAAQTGGTDQEKKPTKGGGGATLTGCLSGPSSEGVYELKSGKKTVEVGGLDDLSKHVGNEVKLHGTWAKGGSEIGEKEEAGGKEGKEGKEEKGERHFKVTSIDHIADTCKGGGEKSKKGSASTTPPPK
ncbi:MAG TPA: hypothetical protein VJA94_24865 [Candidatus Angelobacter sp.]